MEHRKTLSEEEVSEIFSVKPEDITFSLIREWCASTRQAPPKFGAESFMNIPKVFNETNSEETEGNWNVRHCKNWREIKVTTVGRYLANTIMFSRSKQLRNEFDYINEPWNKSIIKKLQQHLGDVLLENLITYDDFAYVLDRLQWLGMGSSSFISPSMTIKTCTIPPITKELKAKLLLDHQDELTTKDSNTVKTVIDIEKQLINSAKKELDGVDPGMDIYNSGARGNFSNNYKNTALMYGSLKRFDNPANIHVSTASLEDGIPKEEFDVFADQIISATYGRSVEVKDAGYLVKQMNYAFQSLRLDPDPKSDCGTSHFYKVFIDDPEKFLYRFVKADNGDLIEITRENLNQFKEKFVLLRSPLYCAFSNRFCSRCAGTLYYRMNILNIGPLTSKMGSKLLNESMKAFHDATLKIKEIDLNKYYQKI
jgi:hypothetical protein